LISLLACKLSELSWNGSIQGESTIIHCDASSVKKALHKVLWFCCIDMFHKNRSGHVKKGECNT
jgi:hypothetical protein